MSQIYNTLEPVFDAYADAIKQNKEDIASLNGSLDDVRADFSEVYLKKSEQAHSGHVYVAFQVIAGRSYTAVNHADKTCTIRTSNTTSADTVQSITDNLRPNNDITFTATADANYVRAYYSDATSGTLTVIDNTTVIPSILESVSSLQNDISPIPHMREVLNTLYKENVITVNNVGYVTLKNTVKAGEHYTVKNNSGLSIAIASAISGTTVDTIVKSISNGNAVSFEIPRDADVLRTYISSATSGTISILDEQSLVPKNINNISSLQNDISQHGVTLDEMLNPVINNSGLWENGGFGYSGIKNNNSGYIRTIDYVSNTISAVYKVDDTYNMYIFGWNEEDICVGYWYKTRWNNDTSLSLRNLTSFNFDAFRKVYPGYKYKIVLYKNGINIDTIDNVLVFKHYVPDLGEQWHSPMLTFIDDDGYAQSGAIWEDIAITCNIPVTMALVTGNTGIQDYALTWEDVRRLKNIGFEFVSHTNGHIWLGDTELTESDVVNDFRETISALESHNCESKFLVYPYTTITEANKAIVRKYFLCGISLQNAINEPYISKDLVHRYDINSGIGEKVIDGQTVTVHLFRTLENIKEIIDEAVLHNGWIIFMSHLRNTYNGDQYYYDNDVKQLICDTVAYARSKNVSIVTVSEGFKKYRDVMI